MAATQISRKGFGQVELNHVSGIVKGEIYAQLPAKSTFKILEQGRFMKYDMATGEVNLTGEGEWLLVYNEEHFYDERHTYHKDFALQADEFTDGKIYPRLIKTDVNDILTTNTFGENTSRTATVTGVALDQGDYVKVDTATGYLTSGDGRTDTAPVMTWQVVKVYTMPDGQPGVKLQRVF